MYKRQAKDPWAGKKLFDYEIKARGFELRSAVARYVDDTTGTMKNVINLDHVFYVSGSSDLNSDLSKHEFYFQLKGNRSGFYQRQVLPFPEFQSILANNLLHYKKV